jgi:hypothetical protein
MVRLYTGTESDSSTATGMMAFLVLRSVQSLLENQPHTPGELRNMVSRGITVISLSNIPTDWSEHSRSMVLQA